MLSLSLTQNLWHFCGSKIHSKVKKKSKRTILYPKMHKKLASSLMSYCICLYLVLLIQSVMILCVCGKSGLNRVII